MTFEISISRTVEQLASRPTLYTQRRDGGAAVHADAPQAARRDDGVGRGASAAARPQPRTCRQARRLGDITARRSQPYTHRHQVSYLSTRRRIRAIIYFASAAVAV